MAPIQGHYYKWILVFLSISTTLLNAVSGCHPSSKQLHICLNIYLERDFSLIETIVKGQGKFGRSGVILEGPDLSNYCRHIANLKDCFADLYPQCDTLWQIDRYVRMMGVLSATHDYLCDNNKKNLRDLLLNSGCMVRSKALLANCTGFDWSMSWKKVLRMQEAPQDNCRQLDSYQSCLKEHLSNVICGPDAIGAFQRLIDVWLQYWCGKNSTPEEDKKSFYLALSKFEESRTEKDV